jgi:hypothetical protein
LVVARIAPEQQVVEIELADRVTAALELNFTQRADGLDATAGEQCVGDRR